MMQTTHLDPRIGALGNGKFYAFTQGYDKPEIVGTLHEVEQALGLAFMPLCKPLKVFDVVMHFEYPAWDEMDGIRYPSIHAASKAQANKFARREAERDGHAVGGRGRYWFIATESLVGNDDFAR